MRSKISPWALGVLLSCSTATAQDPIDIPISSLPCHSGSPSEPGAWESASWPPFPDESCRWLKFEGQKSYRIEHPLARRPFGIQLFLSFHENGRDSAPSAGDMSRIVEVNSTDILLRNNTNQDFFLKVVLH